MIVTLAIVNLIYDKPLLFGYLECLLDKGVSIRRSLINFQNKYDQSKEFYMYINYKIGF